MLRSICIRPEREKCSNERETTPPLVFVPPLKIRAVAVTTILPPPYTQEHSHSHDDLILPCASRMVSHVARGRLQVSEETLFHPKDLVDAPSNGPCARSVLRCLAALSEAVRKHANTDPPGTFYTGPLLGDGRTLRRDRAAARGYGRSAGVSGSGGSLPTSPDSSLGGGLKKKRLCKSEEENIFI